MELAETGLISIQFGDPFVCIISTSTDSDWDTFYVTPEFHIVDKFVILTYEKCFIQNF